MLRREMASKRSSGRGMPARPAMATRWTMAFVEPPSAIRRQSRCRTKRHLKKRGFRLSQTFSTICRPAWAAIRQCEASLAGMDEAPGNVRPRVSAMAVIVEAVPIVMQWPCDRAIPSSTSSHASSESLRAFLRPETPDVRAAPENLAAPVPAEHWTPGTKIKGRAAESAPMIRAGVVLSQAPRSTVPSIG